MDFFHFVFSKRLKLLEICLKEWFKGWSTCLASINHQVQNLVAPKYFLRHHSKKLKLFARKRMIY
jgi:hypothetical protein